MWRFKRKPKPDVDTEAMRAQFERALRAFEESLPAKRLEKIERDLVDLADRHDELHRAHARLRSRQGMRDLRERRANGDDGGPTLEELERKHGLRR